MNIHTKNPIKDPRCRAKRVRIDTSINPAPPVGKKWTHYRHSHVGIRTISPLSFVVHSHVGLVGSSDEKWVSGLEVDKYYAASHTMHPGGRLAGSHELGILLANQHFIDPRWREERPAPLGTIGSPDGGVPQYAFRGTIFEADLKTRYCLIMYLRRDGVWDWYYVDIADVVHRSMLTVRWA